MFPSLRAVARCAVPRSGRLLPVSTKSPLLQTAPLTTRSTALLRPFPFSPPPLARARHSLPPRRYDPDRAPLTSHTDPTGHRLRTARPLLTRSSFRRAARSRTTYLLLFVAGGSALLFYLSHLETVPVTGRTRFNMYASPSASAAVRAAGASQARHVLYDLERQGAPPLPQWHPATRRVRRVLDRLLPFSGLPEWRDWEVHVIPDRSANAFILPGGKVFVHAGILSLAPTDSALAAVLGHEIAHAVADHVGERMSTAAGVNVLLYGAMTLVGFIGFGPMLMHYFGGRFLEVALERPMSRVQEREADYIGLMMMSEACFDPREAVGFWERMMRRERGDGEEEVAEWWSTHPSNSARVESIKGWMPAAMERREASDCRTTASFAEGFRRALGTGVIFVG